MSSNRHAGVDTFILFGPRFRAVGLVLPLAAFIGLTFVAPLATMLSRSVHDPVVADALPETLDLLRDWDGTHTPPSRCSRRLQTNCAERTRNAPSDGIATRINRVRGRIAERHRPHGASIARSEGPAWRDTLIGIHAAWGDVQTWHAIRRAGQRFNRAPLSTRAGPGTPKRRPHRPATGRVSRLSAPPVAYPGRESEPDRAVPAARLSGRVSDRPCPTPPGESLAAAGAGSVLDLLAGTNDRLIVLLQTQGVINTAPRRARPDRRRRPPGHGLQHDRHHGRHDPRPAAFHGAAAVRGHAHHPRGCT